mgnify:CR=1 FL=1
MISKNIALQIDPLNSLHYDSDSTLLIAKEFQQRGYELYYYEPTELLWQSGKLFAHVTAITIQRQECKKTAPKTLIPLESFAIILIRQIPPFNQEYLSTTYLLETLKNVFFLNHPQAIRDVAEKLSILHFPQSIPKTIVCNSLEDAEAFARKQQICIAKPLYGCRGSDVIKITMDEPESLGELTGMISKHGFIMMQEFLSKVTADGDKRVIIIDGVITGAIQRMPKKGDFRTNSGLGGTVYKTVLTAKEKIVSEKVALYLKKKNILLAGIDLLEEKLLEINVTSPTCLVALNQLLGLKSEKIIVDHIEKKIKAGILESSA